MSLYKESTDFFHAPVSGKYMEYGYMGYHKNDGVAVFRFWAPDADSVALVGDFCDWCDGISMSRTVSDGMWEVTLKDAEVSEGDKYKYKILSHGKVRYAPDPFAFSSEVSSETASVICDIYSEYKWKDNGWLDYRGKYARSFSRLPLNIYELHMGSWKHGENDTPYTYEEMARELAPYVKQMGYTHIEIMPIVEPCRNILGDLTHFSLFAPSSRFGTPIDFKSFVDSMHEAGIGVILDWLEDPFSQSKDNNVIFEDILGAFFGEDHAAGAASSVEEMELLRNCLEKFLISNADYWIKEYHLDGLCVENTDSLLYFKILKMVEDRITSLGGAQSSEPFLRRLNIHIKGESPDTLMIAGNISAKDNAVGYDRGGLGFDIKWNSSRSNSILEYAAMDFYSRKYSHEKIKFSSEGGHDGRSIIPVSHNEVSRGRRSFLDGMSGDYWRKFAGVRAFLGYIMTQPGKKLTFMGTEVGQFRECNYKRDIEWFLLEYESHAKLQYYISELNHFYLSSPPLWENEDKGGSFAWIEPADSDRGVISYRRLGNDGKELIIIVNFTPNVYENYTLGVPVPSVYAEALNSDSKRFGGSGVINDRDIVTDAKPHNFYPYSLKLRIPPLAMTVLRLKRKKIQRKI